MPNYDYRCLRCGYTWEMQLLIADRDVPLIKPCPSCNAVPENMCTQPFLVPIVERLPAAPGHSYTMNIRKHVPESFKDVLRNIKSKHRGSTIDV